MEDVTVSIFLNLTDSGKANSAIFYSAGEMEKEISMDEAPEIMYLRFSVLSPLAAATARYVGAGMYGESIPTRFESGDAVAIIRKMGTYVLDKSPREYSDIKGHWAETDIMDMSRRFVINGYESGKFLPEEPISRGEFTAIITRGLGLLPSDAAGFSDVSADLWSSPYIGAAQKAGIVKGITDTTFEPEGRVTRQQAMAMLAPGGKGHGNPFPCRKRRKKLFRLEQCGGLGKRRRWLLCFGRDCGRNRRPADAGKRSEPRRGLRHAAALIAKSGLD